MKKMSKIMTLGRKRTRKYPFAKGRRGQNAYWKFVKSLFEDQDYQTYNNPFNMQDVDVVIQDENGRPISVYEVTNYSETTKMDRPRAKRYVDSLNNWKKVNPNIHRAIVVSHSFTVDRIKGVRKMFVDEGIEVIIFKETP